MTTRTDWAALRTHALDAQIRNPKSAFPELPWFFAILVVTLVVVCLTGGPQP